MILSCSYEVDPNQWDKDLAELGGNIFHSSGWALYKRNAEPNLRPCYFYFKSDDQLIGIALGFIEKSKNIFVSFLYNQLIFDSFPVIRHNSEKSLKEALLLLERHARKIRIVKLSVGSFASRLPTFDPNVFGFDITERIEFILSLKKSEDELWHSMEHKRRKNINKAVRYGVTIQDLPVDEGIGIYHKVKADSRERILKRGGPDISKMNNSEDDPVKVLLEKGLCRIVGAKIGDEYTSVGIFSQFNGLVYHMLSGHSQRALETQSPTLLLWECIKRYKAENAEKFNLSGCKGDAINEKSSEHGVYNYKRAYGAEAVRCCSLEKIINRSKFNGYMMLKEVSRRW